MRYQTPSGVIVRWVVVIIRTFFSCVYSVNLFGRNIYSTRMRPIISVVVYRTISSTRALLLAERKKKLFKTQLSLFFRLGRVVDLQYYLMVQPTSSLPIPINMQVSTVLFE